MANVNITVTKRGRPGRELETYAQTVVLSEKQIADIVPNGTGVRIFMKNGIQYLSDQTFNTVSGVITDGQAT